MAQHQSTSSYRTPTSQQTGASDFSVTPKTLVELDVAGLPAGSNASKFATRSGELIRLHIPVNHEDWRNVPDNYKDDVWNTLMGEFEFDVAHVRAVIEVKFPKIWRRYKHDLRKYVIRGECRKKAPKKRSPVQGENQVPEEPEVSEEPTIELTPEQWEDAKERVPDGMNRVVWIDFVDNERKAEKIAKNAKNSECRKMQKIRHTLGRKSYNNKAYKLDNLGVKAVPGETIDKWLLGHQRSDGTVHPSAVEAHNKVTEAKQRNKEIGGSGSNNATLFSQELEDVFGRSRSDGIRGYSSCVSKKQGEMAAITQSALQKSKTQDETKLNAIQSTVAAVQGDVGSVVGKVDAILNWLKSKGAASLFDSPVVSTISPEKGSTTNPTCQKGHNLMNVSPTDRPVESTNMVQSGQVELLNNKGRVVALGVIDAGDVVHGRKVKPHERRVYIEEVFDQTAVIWDCPQGDNYIFLSQITLPTWLIWGEDRLRPVPNES